MPRNRHASVNAPEMHLGSKGWKGRLVNLPPGDTGGVKGLCLEPHDLAIAKYAASREKDFVFHDG
jgi:hypothetical protein